MVIARKVDPAALARSFADEVGTCPDVLRIWYRIRPGTSDPERMSMSFSVQLARESDAVERVIVDALSRIQRENFQRLNVGSTEFTISTNDVLTLADLVGDEAIELSLHGR